jgi:ABC-type dipeptide/oligopeptide/nickel transport system permease subunit
VALSNLFRNKNMVLAGIIFVIILACAVFAPIIAKYDPNIVDVYKLLLPPNESHWFGTDGFGRDIFSRVVYGARLSLTISLSVVLISGFLGSILGMVAGYYKKMELIIMCVMDGLMALPSLLLAMAIVAVLGTGIENRPLQELMQ